MLQKVCFISVMLLLLTCAERDNRQAKETMSIPESSSTLLVDRSPSDIDYKQRFIFNSLEDSNRYAPIVKSLVQDSEKGFNDLGLEADYLGSAIEAETVSLNTIAIDDITIQYHRISMYQSAHNKSDSTYATSSSQKLVIVNALHGNGSQLYLTSNFLWEDCGVPDFLLDSAYTTNILDRDFLAININHKQYECCGARNIDSIRTHLVDLADFSEKANYELYFFDPMKGTCTTFEVAIV